MITQPNRLISLDALRGFTIALMIVVNYPGSEEHVFFTLRHTVWNGLSLTDQVAPFFLFIVGVSIVFAFPKGWAMAHQKKTSIVKYFFGH